MRRLPPRPFLDDIVRTALWIWLGLHVAFAIGGAQIVVSPVVSVALLAILVGLGHLDRSSRGMTLLLANLGFSPRQMALLVLGKLCTSMAPRVTSATAPNPRRRRGAVNHDHVSSSHSWCWAQGGYAADSSSLLLAVATATTRRPLPTQRTLRGGPVRSSPEPRKTPERGPLHYYHGLLGLRGAGW